MIGFISPLHQQYYMCRYQQLRLTRLEDCSASFDRFLQQCISRMSASRISASLARSSSGGIYERQFQMEFYTAAVSYLPSTVSISPDVGAVSIFDHSRLSGCLEQ